MDLLSQLRAYSILVADTAEIDAIGLHKPQDATTNPTLIYAAAQQEKYQELIRKALEQIPAGTGPSPQAVGEVFDHLVVAFGRRILELIPGRVSTEVDARLSFDTGATLAKARKLIGLYRAAGVDSDRILIKIASTWEGIQAAGVLERQGIHCNMTLLFNLGQAAACAQVGATLISPFVGRIFDWHRKAKGVEFPPETDPGVISVKNIYAYLKQGGFSTQVMGASFRSIGQITALAGCDLLTISPKLLEELGKTSGTLLRQLDPAGTQGPAIPRMNLKEKDFRWLLNEDGCANDLLADGIRRFAADAVRLEQYLDGKRCRPVSH